MSMTTYEVRVGTEHYVLRDVTTETMLVIARMMQAADMRNADVTVTRGDDPAASYHWRFNASEPTRS